MGKFIGVPRHRTAPTLMFDHDRDTSWCTSPLIPISWHLLRAHAWSLKALALNLIARLHGHPCRLIIDPFIHSLLLTFVSWQAATHITIGIEVAEWLVEPFPDILREFSHHFGSIERHIGHLEAKSPILARAIQAFGEVDLAVLAFVATETGAIVVVDAVRASGIVLAWLRLAFINVRFTMGAFEPGSVTQTCVGVDSVQTKASIQTRSRLFTRGDKQTQPD